MWTRLSSKDFVRKFAESGSQNSVVPWVIATGCCRYELENAGAATYDWRRLGVLDDANFPDEADILLVAGWINADLAEEIKAVYDSMGGRRHVLAIGACAISGSPYGFSGEKILPVSELLPVDIFVPGCPPRPEAILEALIHLMESRKPKVQRGKVIYDALKSSR